MRIQMRKLRQRQRYRAGNEWKISERRSLALLPRLLERAARRLDARKIDLDGLQHMSAGRFGTHHVFGDPFAQRTKSHGLGIAARRRRRSLMLLQMRQYVVPLDAAIAAGAPDPRNIDAMLGEEFAHRGGQWCARAI